MPESNKRPKKAPARDPYRFRKCKLCRLDFRPTTHVIERADHQEFCSPNHRKEYWKKGAVPYQKMMDRIEKRCREIAREEIAAIPAVWRL
jgi:ribosomal protein S14